MSSSIGEHQRCNGETIDVAVCHLTWTVVSPLRAIYEQRANDEFFFHPMTKSTSCSPRPNERCSSTRL